LRAEVVDGGEHLLAVRRADVHHREVLLLAERRGGLLLVDEPCLFRHLHEKADLHGRVGVRRHIHAERGDAHRRERGTKGQAADLAGHAPVSSGGVVVAYRCSYSEKH
jgi:hypothetical protein